MNPTPEKNQDTSASFGMWNVALAARSQQIIVKRPKGPHTDSVSFSVKGLQLNFIAYYEQCKKNLTELLTEKKTDQCTGPFSFRDVIEALDSLRRRIRWFPYVVVFG